MREREDADVVASELDGREARAVAGPELRAGREEERHVRAEGPGERVQPFVRERDREGVVGEPERGGGVRAAAAEACSDRDPLLDPDAPAGLGARRRGKALERGAHKRVGGETVDG